MAEFRWPIRSEHWDSLIPESELEVVKWRHDGTEAARYPGRVLSTRNFWVAVEAWWIHGTTTQGPLTFENGDRIIEYFSCEEPFNSFATWSGTGEFKGWYANVVYPSWVETRADNRILVWQDLWLDIAADAQRNYVLLDDDELRTSGIADRNPELHGAILAARDRLVSRLIAGEYPFHDRS